MHPQCRSLTQGTPAQSSLRQGTPGQYVGGRMVGLAAGVGILAVGAWLCVPFYPVPLTMQTLAVLLVGGILGPRLGPAAVCSYLALGLMGAPLFHGGLGGLAVLLGPTGGYLVGFVPAALLMGLAGRCTRRRASTIPRTTRIKPSRDVLTLIAGVVTAEVVIYTSGVCWLAALYTGGSLGQAVTAGVTPFLLGEALKMAVAVGAVRLTGRATGRRNRPSL